MESIPDNLMIHIFWVTHTEAPGGWQGERLNIHHHTLYWIHEGEALFTIGDQRHEVSAGSLLYAAPQVHARYQAEGERPLRFTFTRFACAAAAYAKGQWRQEPLEHLGLPEAVYLHAGDKLVMNQRFERLALLWKPPVAYGQALSKLVLGEILLEAGQLKSAASLIRGTDNPAHVAYLNIKERMEHDYDQPLSIEVLSREQGISSVSLRKLFHKHEDCTPKQYLDKIRNEQAIRLMVNTGLSMRCIADSCGYSDEFQFSKSFKKMNGLSPSRFRKQARS